MRRAEGGGRYGEYFGGQRREHASGRGITQTTREVWPTASAASLQGMLGDSLRLPSKCRAYNTHVPSIATHTPDGAESAPTSYVCGGGRRAIPLQAWLQCWTRPVHLMRETSRVHDQCSTRGPFKQAAACMVKSTCSCYGAPVREVCRGRGGAFAASHDCACI